MKLSALEELVQAPVDQSNWRWLRVNPQQQHTEEAKVDSSLPSVFRGPCQGGGPCEWWGHKGVGWCRVSIGPQRALQCLRPDASLVEKTFSC